MGILNRLSDVIKSYSSGGERNSGDPDLDAAFNELDDYLNDKVKFGSLAEGSVKLPPEKLRPDFECLGVPFGASAEVCKAAYKRLLKIHHPDRHAAHEDNFKKATDKSAGINAALGRIDKWRAGQD